MYSFPNPNPGRKGLKLSLTAGGLTIGLGLAYLYYQNRKKGNSNELDISKETVIRILKEFRKEFYPVFKNLSLASMKIQNEYKTRYQMPADQMKEVLQIHLVEENPVFKPQILDIEDRVYRKFDVINRQEFERLCQTLAKTDPTIRTLVNEIKELFKLAISGTLKPPAIDLPLSFSPEKVLEVYKETVKQVLRTIAEFVGRYIEEHGSISPNDESFHLGIQNLSIDQIKSRIIKSAGLDVSEEFHPQQVFTFAINKYTKENSAFSEKLNKIESLNQELMKDLFAPNANFEQIISELERFDQAIAPPRPIIDLARPDELVSPVEVHVNKDASFTIHIDDHVHLEKSANEGSPLEKGQEKNADKTDLEQTQEQTLIKEIPVDKTLVEENKDLNLQANEADVKNGEGSPNEGPVND